MDLSLPVIDGWEATRRLKASVALHDIPIIALSAHAIMGDAEQALQNGCDDYLSQAMPSRLAHSRERGLPLYPPRGRTVARISAWATVHTPI